jgi:hypothetical protein
METLPLYVTLSLTTIVSLSVLALIGLKGFRAWIELKTLELGAHSTSPPSAAQRIDVADLKERIRKLEAIASGVEL